MERHLLVNRELVRPKLAVIMVSGCHLVPVIPPRHSRFLSHTQASVAGNATLLSAELLQPGRKHHGAGELLEFGLCSST
jgi:hypothetical protein